MEVVRNGRELMIFSIRYSQWAVFEKAFSDVSISVVVIDIPGTSKYNKM